MEIDLIKDILSIILATAKMLISVIILSTMYANTFFFYMWIMCLSVDLLLMAVFNLKYLNISPDFGRTDEDILGKVLAVVPISIDIYCALLLNNEERRIENKPGYIKGILFIKILQNLALAALFAVIWIQESSIWIFIAGLVHAVDSLLILSKVSSDFYQSGYFD